MKVNQSPSIFEGVCASTVITNMEQVALAINKPADKIMNYFGSKLGSRVKINENTNSLYLFNISLLILNLFIISKLILNKFEVAN